MVHKIDIPLPEEDPAPVKALPQCAWCGSPSKTVCGRCKARAYCSNECQKLDWKSGHQTACSPALPREPVKEEETFTFYHVPYVAHWAINLGSWNLRQGSREHDFLLSKVDDEDAKKRINKEKTWHGLKVALAKELAIRRMAEVLTQGVWKKTRWRQDRQTQRDYLVERTEYIWTGKRYLNSNARFPNFNFSTHVCGDYLFIVSHPAGLTGIYAAAPLWTASNLYDPREAFAEQWAEALAAAEANNSEQCEDVIIEEVPPASAETETKGVSEDATERSTEKVTPASAESEAESNSEAIVRNSTREHAPAATETKAKIAGEGITTEHFVPDLAKASAKSAEVVAGEAAAAAVKVEQSAADWWDGDASCWESTDYDADAEWWGEGWWQDANGDWWQDASGQDSQSWPNEAKSVEAVDDLGETPAEEEDSVKQPDEHEDKRMFSDVELLEICEPEELPERRWRLRQAMAAKMAYFRTIGQCRGRQWSQIKLDAQPVDCSDAKQDAVVFSRRHHLYIGDQRQNRWRCEAHDYKGYSLIVCRAPIEETADLGGDFSATHAAKHLEVDQYDKVLDHDEPPFIEVPIVELLPQRWHSDYVRACGGGERGETLRMNR
mmetsp:Transcript_13256/g.22944  ORF Transcript_13256/g.22944 Transcript_13256/m.22944 type:complete len:609 (+) Transcript_13256:63-1889(+)